MFVDCECGNARMGPKFTKDQCVRCWAKLNSERHRKLYAKLKTKGFRVRTRRLPMKCAHLGERLEFLAGCQSGMRCRHRCDFLLSLPVVEHLSGVMECVPANDCQGCPGFTS